MTEFAAECYPVVAGTRLAIHRVFGQTLID